MLRNIRGADLVVVFISQSYIESYACFLELLTAVNNKKQIVFVALDQKLRLGDTTDQPVVERGVKNEILNQGANIFTNTNNSSNDIMRAMKSAFTSISTLLEQDALSKYDISDAFINFFRDASINKKTINDLGAHKNAKQPEVQTVQEYRPETQAAGPEEQMTAEPELQTAAEPKPEVTPAADFRFDELESKTPAKSKFDLHNKKFLALLIGGACALAAIVCVVVLIAIMPRHVEAMSYEFSMFDENSNSKRLYAGTYTGDWKNEMPYEQGTFVYEEDNEDNLSGFVYEGQWQNGLANGQGTMTWASGSVYEGEWKDDVFVE